MTTNLENTNGSIAIDQTITGITNGVSIVPSAVNGLIPQRWKSNGSDYQFVMKNAGGKLTGLSVSNDDASAKAYLRIYDKATNPNAASDTPLRTYLIPPGGREIRIPDPGYQFANGIACTLTTGSMADTDTTAAGADKVVVNYDVN